MISETKRVPVRTSEHNEGSPVTLLPWATGHEMMNGSGLIKAYFSAIMGSNSRCALTFLYHREERKLLQPPAQMTQSVSAFGHKHPWGRPPWLHVCPTRRWRYSNQTSAWGLRFCLTSSLCTIWISKYAAALYRLHWLICMQSVQVMRQVEKKAKLGRQVSLERKDVLTAVWGGSVINLKLALCLQAVKVGHSPVSVQQKELCSNLSSKLYLLFELIQTFSQIMSS